MGWATQYIAALQRGETVSFRPRGNSMMPRIASGQLCTVAPVASDTIAIEDVVLCRVKGAEYLHLVKAVERARQGARGRLRFLIGNARGHVNGWIGPDGIFGRLVSVED